jgi:hypothetical protein
MRGSRREDDGQTGNDVEGIPQGLKPEPCVNRRSVTFGARPSCAPFSRFHVHIVVSSGRWTRLSLPPERSARGVWHTTLPRCATRPSFKFRLTSPASKHHIAWKRAGVSSLAGPKPSRIRDRAGDPRTASVGSRLSLVGSL